jgi:hypothetical protein
LGPGTGT